MEHGTYLFLDLVCSSFLCIGELLLLRRSGAREQNFELFRAHDTLEVLFSELVLP